MAKEERVEAERLAEIHMHEYFKHDLPGPGSQHNQIFIAGYEAGIAKAHVRTTELQTLLVEKIKDCVTDATEATRKELDDCIAAHDENIKVLREMQKLCAETLPEMEKLTKERDEARAEIVQLKAQRDKATNDKLICAEHDQKLMRAAAEQAWAEIELLKIELVALEHAQEELDLLMTIVKNHC